MPAVNHQTIKLSRGRHRSPEDGACVMELASMLAGEPFSDHCRRVCPTLGAFLRGYNDNVDPVRRQELLPFATEAVDTDGGEPLAAARAARCLAFARRAHGARRWRLPWGPRFPYRQRSYNCEVAGRVAALAVLDDPAWHRRTLDFIAELIALGDAGRLAPRTPGELARLPLPEPAAESTPPEPEAASAPQEPDAETAPV